MIEILELIGMVDELGISEIEQIHSFVKAYEPKLQQPIVKNFLKDEGNRYLLISFILRPNEEIRRKLDLNFKKFYKKARITKYLDSLIRIFSIDYDKKNRRINNRFLLVLDGPVGEGMEQIQPVSSTTLDMQLRERIGLSEQIEDEKLYKALKKLPKKQLFVLELIYSKGLTNLEIAKYVGESPQNISNIHKKALKKLQGCFKKFD